MNIEDVKILIATPVYESFKPNYVASLFNTTKELSEHISWGTEIGNTHIDDARNEFVKLLLEYEQFTHILFIDADMSWNVDDIKELIKHSDNEENQIVCGFCTKQQMDYNSLYGAVRKGCPPEELYNFTGKINNYFFDVVDKNTDFNYPVEVNCAGSGFMLINKNVFTILQGYYSDSWYLSRYGDRVYKFFEKELNKEQGVVGEEVSFIRRWRDIGGKVFVLPWVSIGHIGSFEFRRKLI